MFSILAFIFQCWPCETLLHHLSSTWKQIFCATQQHDQITVLICLLQLIKSYVKIGVAFLNKYSKKMCRMVGIWKLFSHLLCAEKIWSALLTQKLSKAKDNKPLRDHVKSECGRKFRLRAVFGHRQVLVNDAHCSDVSANNGGDDNPLECLLLCQNWKQISV